MPADNNMDAAQLKEMVHSVNREEVEEIEVLSDNVYYYDREKDKIIIAYIYHWQVGLDLPAFIMYTFKVSNIVGEVVIFYM